MTISFPTKLTSGIVKLDEIRFLLYGPPKIGKTTLTSGFPNVLHLMTEKRYKHLKLMKIDIKSWVDFQEAVELIISKKHEYKIISVDTVDVLYSLCVDYICTKLNIPHPTDMDYGKGFDMIFREFDKWINKLFLSNYGLIFVSHTRVVELFNRTGKISKIVPTLANTGRRAIVPKVSVIGYLDVKVTKINDKYMERRILSFEPSETLEAGDGDGRLPKEIVTSKDPKQTYEIFAKSYVQ